MNRSDKQLYEKIMRSISKEIKHVLNEETQSFNVANYTDDEDPLDNQTINNMLWNFPGANELKNIFSTISWEHFNIVNRDYEDYIRIYNKKDEQFIFWTIRQWFKDYIEETGEAFDEDISNIGTDSAVIWYCENDLVSNQFIIYSLRDDKNVLEYYFTNTNDPYESKHFTLLTIQTIPVEMFDSHTPNSKYMKKVPIDPLNLINFYLENEINLKFGGNKKIENYTYNHLVDT